MEEMIYLLWNHRGRLNEMTADLQMNGRGRIDRTMVDLQTNGKGRPEQMIMTDVVLPSICRVLLLIRLGLPFSKDNENTYSNLSSTLPRTAIGS